MPRLFPLKTMFFLALSTTALACSADGAGGAPSLALSSPPGQPDPAATDVPGASGGDGAAEERCVDAINAYRRSVGRPALERWSSKESCASDEASSDAASGRAHGAFGRCDEHAQNECPGWSGPKETMIAGCLKAMWSEGPGGGHYDNMANAGYTKVACGFHVLPDGHVWSVQDFR